MPLDHKNKVFFIHIPKTGGSTIEDLLDIVRPKSEQEQKKVLFGNWKGGSTTKFGTCYHHQPLSRLIQNDLLSSNVLNEYFTFTFVRNPYDRLLSEYYHRGRPCGDFNTFVKYLLKWYENEQLLDYFFNHLLPQWEFIFLNGDMSFIDFIGYYENLKDDLEELKNKLDIDKNKKIPHKKKGPDNKEKINKESIDIINYIYKDDFDLFNYKMK